MKAAFWRFAHRRYQTRRPRLLFEISAFLWGGLFLFLYGAALCMNFRANLPVLPAGLILSFVPLALGFLHRRIRIEWLKGGDALYRKRLATNA